MDAMKESIIGSMKESIIGTIKEELKTADIPALKESIRKVDEKIDNFSDQLSTVQEELDALKETKGDNATDIESNQQQINQVARNHSLLQFRVTEAETVIDEESKKNDKRDKDMSELFKRVKKLENTAALQSIPQDVTSKISMKSVSTETLVHDKSTLQSSASAHPSTVGTHPSEAGTYQSSAGSRRIMNTTDSSDISEIKEAKNKIGL